MRQPFLLGTFVYIALVAGRISNGKDLQATKEDAPFITGPQKDQEIATANPIIRAKRVTNDPEDITFWANRGRRREYQSPDIAENFIDYIESPVDSDDFGEVKNKRTKEDATKNCPDGCTNRSRREEVNEPFWGNRGKKNEETNIFWGNRGRRSETGTFWGNRGKKESDYRDKKNPVDFPFWGNRGKRNDGPFWGNRGRRSNEVADFNPFWGNRGKREEIEPFWGNRGRRNDPFWAVRGKKENGSRMNRKYATDENFLELIGKSKCFSNFLNGIYGRDDDMLNTVLHFQEPIHSSNNILVYTDDNAPKIVK